MIQPFAKAFAICCIVAGLTIPSLGQVSGFVTRSGTVLTLNGQTFRYAGANIYWLGLDENVGGVAYPTHFRVDDTLLTAKEMGATVVRAHTLGVSTGNALSVEPSLGTFNDSAFAAIDYAIASASKNGIRLIIPLTDDYAYYHGGKHNFTDWRGVAESTFYTNTTVIADFEAYINHLLNHVSTITGIALKNDPAIMAWETGNEISPPSAWTSTISAYIKSVDTHHLVLDGHYGVDTGARSLSTVDLVGAHFNGTRYAMTASALNTQAALASGYRPFIVGEFDWSNYHGTGDLSGFLSGVQSNSVVAGATYWSLFGHLDTYGYEQHNDNFTLHYPGDTTDKRTRAQQLRTFAYTISGLAVPGDRTPNQPVITSVDSSGKVAWRGSVAGDTYQLERSTSGLDGPWVVATTGTVTDNTTPYQDITGTFWYRVKAKNLSGGYGAYSGFYKTGGPVTFTDSLNNFNYIAAKSANLSFDTSNPTYFNGDTSRVRRSVDDTESFYYVLNNITSVTVRVYTKSTAAVLQTVFKIYSSTDGGTTFSDLTYTLGGAHSGGGGGWYYYDVSPSSIPAGTNAFKINMYAGSGQSYDPEISQVTLTYGN